MDAVHLGSDRDARCGPGGIAFYGPYVVVDGPEGNLPLDSTPHVECTLRMVVQFKGQR